MPVTNGSGATPNPPYWKAEVSSSNVQRHCILPDGPIYCLHHILAAGGDTVSSGYCMQPIPGDMAAIFSFDASMRLYGNARRES
jgi:hypothetical protein